MEFHTLQEYFTFTKGVIYIVIVATLVGMTAFWNFLTGRDDD
jgi:hypothetical protein